MIKMESYEYLDETMCDDVSSTEEKYWNNLACEQSKESSSTFDDSFQSDFVNVMSTDAEDYSVEQKTSNLTPKRRGHREKKPEINLDLPYELQQSNRILNELTSDSIKAVNWPFLLDPLPVEAIRKNANTDSAIKEPMWLNKIRAKLENGDYQTITQFVADLRLMLQNCFRYYGTNHIISKRGLKLETIVEQKLALLPRELREKTNLAATSGIPDDDFTSPYSSSSSRRRFRYNHSHQSSQILNQLRQEHIEQEREHRKSQVQERKAANEAFYQDVLSWENDLLKEPINSSLKAMWELPQIGLFLYLAQAALNLPEISQFEVERIFLIPKESCAVHSLMTSLLSTPYQRMQLDKKPDMPYKVWHEKLKNKVSHWYKVLHDKGNTFLAATNLGLDTNMFKVIGMSNPFEEKAFHELSFQQRVWIVKSLCDVCCEKETSIQEAINAHPLLDQRAYLLGCDSQDNSYLHFPQFCGADLRIYKQAPLPIPKMPKLKRSEHRKYVSKPIPTPVKKRKQVRKFSTRPKIQSRKLKFASVIVPADESESHSEDSETEEESLEPNLEKFSLIVDSVESLRKLIDQFKDDNIKTRKVKEVSLSRCERELHKTLCNILTELEPWEPKLIQANKKACLKLHKEYDNFKKQPPEVEPKEENVWDSEEDKQYDSDVEFDSDKDERDASNISSSLDESELNTLNTSNFSPQRKKKTVKCLGIKKEVNSEPLDVSSRGRIRKARQIPNNIENTRPRKSFKLKKPEFVNNNQLEDRKPFDFNSVPKAGLEILSQAALSYNPPNPLPKKNLIYQPIANTSNDDSKMTTVTSSGKVSPIKQISPQKKNLTYYNYIGHPSSTLENQPAQQPSTAIKTDSATSITKPVVTTPKQAQVMSQLQKQGFRVEAGPDGKVLLYVTHSSQSQNQIASNKPSSVESAKSAPLTGNANNVTGLQAALAALQAISKPKYANNITVKSLLESSADKQKTNVSPVKHVSASNNTQTLSSNHENKPPSNFLPSTAPNKLLQVYNAPITTNQTSCLGSVLVSKSESVSSLPSNVPANNINISLVTVSGVPPSFSNVHARMSASTVTTSSTLSAPITTPQVRISTPTTIAQNNMLLKVLPQGISPQTFVIQQNPATSKSNSTNSLQTVFVGQNVHAAAKAPGFVSSPPSRFPMVTSPEKMNLQSDNQNLINKLLSPQSFVLQGQNIIGTLLQPSSSTSSPSVFNVNSPTKGQLSVRLSTPSATLTASNATPFTNSQNIFMSSNTTCPQLVSSVPKAISSFGITSCNLLPGQQISRSPKNIRKVTSEPPPLQSILGRPVNQSKTVNLNPMVSTLENLTPQGMVTVQNTSKNCMLNQPSGLSLGTLQHSISPGGNLINVSTPMQTVAKETLANMRPLINQPTVLNLGTNTTLMQQGKNIVLQQPSVISNNGREAVNAVAPANNQTFHVNTTNVPSNIPLQTPQNSQKVFLLNIDGRLVAAQGIPMTLNSMGQPTTQIVLSGTPLGHKPTIPTTIVPSRLILTQPVLVQGQQNKMNLPNGSVPGKFVQNSFNSGLIGQPPVLHLSQPAMLVSNKQTISTTNTTTVINQRSSQME